MASSSASSTTATNKLLVLFLLLVLDLGMNCSFDFDSYNLTGKDLITVPLVIQLIIQISIFLVIFLSMAATYLFRVGLLGILIKKFRSVLLLHPLYIFLTLLTGSYRIYLLGEGYDLVKLWEHDEFVALSLVHKCGLSSSSSSLLAHFSYSVARLLHSELSCDPTISF
jgi:hypothetical protein